MYETCVEYKLVQNIFIRYDIYFDSEQGWHPSSAGLFELCISLYYYIIGIWSDCSFEKKMLNSWKLYNCQGFGYLEVTWYYGYKTRMYDWPAGDNGTIKGLVEGIIV